MILILADAFDTHADAVESYLDGNGEESFRLDLDVASLKKTYLSYHNGSWRITTARGSLQSEVVKCVWPRRLTVSLSLEEKALSCDNDLKLWQSEWNRHLFGLYASLRGEPWVNPISAANLADNKFYQFSVAHAAGFRIPDFIVSNERKVLLDFVGRDTVALKFLSQEMFPTKNGSFSGLYVNKVRSSEIDDFMKSEENPIFLQRYVEKKYEVRHTFVNGKHFCCRIDSQQSERARVDWRRYDLHNTPHSAIVAPKDVCQKIEQLMTLLGLTYGAFDFIVDQDDQWWYLEVNSAGQWLWIEDLVGLPISEAMAHTLRDFGRGGENASFWHTVS